MDDITVIFADLHTAILGSIAKNVVDSLAAQDELTPSAIKRIETAQTTGLLRDEIAAHVATALAVTTPEVIKLFNDAAVKSLAYDSEVYRAAGLDPIDIKQSPTMLKILQAGISKQMGSINRLTGTIAINSEELFERTLNTAYNKTVSGTHSQTEALNEGMDELAREGVTAFYYSSGRNISIEAALLMNIRTGIAQTTGELTRQGMIERQASYVQVSAHKGARNKGNGHKNHADWQGKFYYFREVAIEPNIHNLLDFVITCGLDLVDGILGANCRHHYGPAFPGITHPRYTDEDLSEMNGVTYTETLPDGTTRIWSAYDANQHLNRLALGLRNWKRRRDVKQAARDAGADVDIAFEKKKVKEWIQRIDDFTKSTGLRRQHFRERVAKL